MHSHIQQKVTDYITIANRYFGTCMSVPKINVNQRGKAAGTAWLTRWEVRFNPVLLEDNFTEFLNQVVPHEVAHLVVFDRYQTPHYRPKPHGKEWKFVMETVFSRPAITRHTFDIKKTQGQTFDYNCGCRIHVLTKIRHNKVQRGKARYYCAKCKKELIYTGNDLF